MSKGIPVPTMSKLQPYEDWKKELRVWEVTNTTLNIDKKVQAGTLFHSLQGLCKETVISELSVEEITAEDGVNKIISTLDEFFLGNEEKNSYIAIDDLLNLKCGKDETLESFIVQFNLKINKVKASGTVLPEGMLGYALLKSANLSSEKHAMVRATCDNLSFKNVKTQLEKVGLIKYGSTSDKFSAKSESPKVKLENCFYSNNPECDEDLSHEFSSSDEEKVFYSKTPYQGPSNNNNSKLKMNSVDRFGHVRSCSFCKCVYHWMADCPYAPATIKNNLKSKVASWKNSKTL